MYVIKRVVPEQQQIYQQNISVVLLVPTNTYRKFRTAKKKNDFVDAFSENVFIIFNVADSASEI